jgi:hypothetical protein
MLHCVDMITKNSNRGNPVEPFSMRASPKVINQEKVCTVLNKKREVNAVTDSSLSPFMTTTKRYSLLNGVTSFDRLLFMFTASTDGVSVWKQSQINNSIYVFSMFNENLSRRSAMRNLDAFCVFLVRCNTDAPVGAEPSPSLNVFESFVADSDLNGPFSTPSEKRRRRSANDNNHSSSVMDANENSIGAVTTIGGEDTALSVSLGSPSGKKCPADSDFREILHLALGYIKEYGKRGFCIRSGSTLYSIHYAITSFRCDIPAQETLVDSTGKHSSNSPCLTCDTRVRVFDKYYMGFLPCVQASMARNRSSLATLNSSALVLNPDDPLRLLPAFLLGKNMSAVKEKMRENLKDNDEMYTVLVKLCSFIPPNALVYQLPETESCNLYGSGNPFVSTHAGETIGRIDIEKVTFLKKESCTAADLMHLTHNVADRILAYLFVTDFSKETVEDEAMMYAKGTIYQNKSMAFRTTSIFEILRKSALDRLNSIYAMLPSDLQSWVKALVEDGVYKKPTANQKMRFCFSVLPYLLIDSLHYCVVWCFVQFFSVLSTMYNFDGPFEEMESLQGVMDTTLYVMENQVPPSFFTLCFHQCLHLDIYYAINGPLKSIDCYHGEQQYSGLADESVGGNKRDLTIAKRRIVLIVCCLCAKGASLCGPGTPILNSQGNMQVFNDKSFLRRGELNWIADKYRFTADSLPLVSFTDVELCGGVHSYLSTGTISHDTGLVPPSNSDVWATSVGDLNGYWNKHYTFVTSHFTYAKKWDKLRWNNQNLSTFSGEANSSDGEVFPRAGLAAAYSVDRKIHLFAVVSYFSFHVSEEEAHFQAQVFELPIHRLLPLNDCPFSFYLKVAEVKAMTPCYTMISLHRLHMNDVFCFPIDKDTMYIGLDTICVRQWQIIHQVCFPITNNKKENDFSVIEL